jgi:hypothetical protein
MPRYIVQQERSAVILYEAVVEAESAGDALYEASADRCEWVRVADAEYDDRVLSVFAEGDKDRARVLATAED